MPDRDAKRAEGSRRDDVHDRGTCGVDRRFLRHPIEPVAAFRRDTAWRAHDRASAEDAWQLCDILDDTLKEGTAAPVRALRRRRGLHQEHVRRLKTERALLKRDEASDEQRAAGDENDGNRDLGHDERLARAAPAPSGRHPTGVQSKPLVDVDSCGLESGRQPEQNADEHAEEQREQQHASVDGHLLKARDVRR